jgi:hypothetical protein
MKDPEHLQRGLDSLAEAEKRTDIANFKYVVDDSMNIKVNVETLCGQVYKFTLQEIRFLDALRSGKNLGEAVKQTKMDWKRGYNLLQDHKTKRYLGDLAYERVQVEGFTPERWVAEGIDVWKGRKKADRQQMVVWQELGSRIMPKAKESSQEKGPVININIEALSEAERRIKVSQVEEAKIVPEGESSGSDDES